MVVDELKKLVLRSNQTLEVLLDSFDHTIFVWDTVLKEVSKGFKTKSQSRATNKFWTEKHLVKTFPSYRDEFLVITDLVQATLARLSKPSP